MSIVVATLCREGIAMAADSRCMAVTEKEGPETGLILTETLGLGLTTEKIMLIDNNVAIGMTGRDEIKDMNGSQYLKEYFAEWPGLNAKQVAEEINRLFVQDDEIVDVHVMVAGMMEGLRKMDDGRRKRCKKPVIYTLSTEVRGRMGTMDKPGAVCKGETDIVTRLLAKKVTFREGRYKYAISDFIIPFNLFSLRDAIGFSELAVEMTMRLMRFQNREQTVGPPIDVLVITREGAKWYRHEMV